MKSGLRRLDDEWVPKLAVRLRDLGRRPRTGPIASLAGDVTTAMRAQPALAGSIAVVFAAGLLFGTAGTGADGGNVSVPPIVIPTAPSAAVATIGPSPDTSVSAYLTRASADFRHYTEIAADRPTYAVVDFRRYLRPDRALRVLGDTAVVRAYVRVPSRRPTQPRSVPMATGSDLGTGMLTAATVAKATAKSYQALLAALKPHNRADRQVKGRYAAQRRAALLEASRLSHPQRCACVFAFVVHAGPARLAALRRDPDVRVVDPAPPVVTLTGLTVLPLQPQVKTVVPRVGLPGG